jgi:RNA polymerase sigma-70 factor (ECF subfamily)
VDGLLQRCIPALRRWARGRLPESARGRRDAADLVQRAVLAAMERQDAFEPRHQGALQAYLRQEVMKQLPDERTSALDQVIGPENIDRYEKAVQRLPPDAREAIIGRIELQYSYEDLAVEVTSPSIRANPDGTREIEAWRR